MHRTHSEQNRLLRAVKRLKVLRLIDQHLSEIGPQKTLTMFPSMPQVSDFMQIGPDLLQCALSVNEIFSLMDAEHSYAIGVLDNILVYVNRLNNE